MIGFTAGCGFRTIADALGRMGEQTLAYALAILADQTERAEARMCIALALGQTTSRNAIQRTLLALGAHEPLTI